MPGLVYATVRQGMTTRTFPIEVRRTASGHYVALMPDNRWSIECLTVEAALLMYAAMVFPVEQEQSPWLANPRPAPFPAERMAAEDRRVTRTLLPGDAGPSNKMTPEHF
ncbi:hypothetical protein [Gluconobacter morbifer]|uniref:hypothetical protein n=1 Tax=Gluconobacter morbifer TaxID=479935 RepID=UPI001FE1AD54|nr:hypothetical protein [Gluconobacter morbifer]